MKRSDFVARLIMSCLTLCIVLTGFTLPGAFGQQSVFADPLTSGVGQELRLIKSDEESIILELYTSAYQVSEKAIGGTGCHSLSIEGYGETSEVGRPQLPVKGVMLGVPAEAKVEVRVLEADSTLVAKRYNVCPVPKVVVREDPYDIKTLKQPFGFGPADIEYVFTKDESVYSTDEFYPTDLVQVASSGYLRDQRFVQLQLHPLQYNPASQQLRFHRKMKVELRFVYGSKARPAAGTGEIGGPFEGIMRNSLLNYESAKRWRSRAALRSVSIRGENPPASQLSWKVAVNEDGIYELSYADLSTEGFPSGVSSSTLKLFNEGSEVAIYVHDLDGVFGSGDYILFYGQKMNTKYTDTNVYWLTQGETAGLRMPQKDGTLSGTKTVPASFNAHKKVEEDLWCWTYMPGGDELDRWAWNYVLAPGIPSRTYHLTLTTIVTDSYTATLRVSLYGVVDQDHHTKLYVNDQLVEDATWDGFIGRINEVSFPQSYLVEGDNSIKVECLKDPGVSYDFVFVDWVEVGFHDAYITENDQLRFSGDQAETWEYPWEYHIGGFTTSDIEVFDITYPATTTRIVSTTVESTSSYTPKFEDTITDRREYLALTTAQRSSPLSIKQDASSDLRSAGQGADYIIITHADFYDEVLPLASRRAGQGLRTIVVDVEDVYDEFSYGVLDARAIRDFLAYAYQNWVPSPSYVLLVGDGNYDCKNNLGSSPLNYVPPYLAFVDTGTGGIGETATDNRYVTVSGDDIVPDMHIGRLPISSSAEASTVINKILDYEQDPAGGDWNQKALFVADNVPDSSGDFVALSNDIVDNYLPGSYADDKVYLNDYCGPPTSPPSTCPAATEAITETISDGRLLVNYIGHGGNALWAHEGVFRADATRNDIDSLTNGTELSMMLSMTCVTGYFHHPSAPCLDEQLVRAESKGAIASWSATGFGMALGHHYLNQGFFTAVFSDTISEIGTATYLGKLNLYNSTTGYRDLMDTYVLFGDPFMKLNLPACDAADFDNDGRISVVDIMLVAARWDNEWGDANYDRRYDLDDDGDIDIVDIMRVAARWDQVC